MPVEFNSSSIEARVLRLLQEAYPITVVEIERKLRISPVKLKRVLNNLELKGLIELRTLPGRTFVDLVSGNFRFSGRNPSQKKKLKHTKRLKTKETEEYDGPMFG